MRFYAIRCIQMWSLFYWKIILGIFAILHSVLSEEIQNFTESQITNETKNIECGDTQKMVDKCFTDLPPHLMEFLTTPKIAVDAEEIKSKCTVFNRGMECFDAYTARCLTKAKLNIFQNNVEGARNFFLKFCGDAVFQRDYLRHRDCFSHIQDDWMRCTLNFQSILSNELHEVRTNVTNKFMEFCCARYAFENCIYNSARYKCYQNSASFARETAKMLSDEKHFSNCRQYETALCVSDNAQPLRYNSIWYLGLSMLALIILLQS